MSCQRLSLPTPRCTPVVRGLDNEEAIFVGEMMAKEDSNSANGCDEVGMSVANDEDFKLNWAKRTYAVKNSLVRFTIVDNFGRSSALLNVPTELDSLSE